MSDEAFSLPPTPLMTPQKARDVGRAYKALAQMPPADDHRGRE